MKGLPLLYVSQGLSVAPAALKTEHAAETRGMVNKVVIIQSICVYLLYMYLAGLPPEVYILYMISRHTHVCTDISVDAELVRKNIKDKRADHHCIGEYIQQSHMLSNSLVCIEAMHLKSVQVHAYG